MARAETPAPDSLHPEIEERFSDYYEETLDADARKDLAAHLAGCETCRDAYEQFTRALSALGGMHRMNAPQTFEKDVEDSIRRRSAGRFFGRKAFGDRIPLELLAVVILLLGLVLFALLRSSQTGSLRYDSPPEQPDIDPGARDVLPTPPR